MINLVFYISPAICKLLHEKENIYFLSTMEHEPYLIFISHAGYYRIVSFYFY